MIRVTTLTVLAILAAGCGARAEPTGSLGMQPVSVVDGTGATIALSRAARHVASSDAAATATLQALHVDVAAFAPGGAVPAGTDLVIISGATGGGGEITDVPVFHWGVGNLADAGFQIAQVALATDRGGAGVVLGRTVDAAVKTALARSLSEPMTTVFIESSALTEAAADDPLVVLVRRLGSKPAVAPGTSMSFPQLRRLAPAAWIAVEPATSTLAALRLAPGLRPVPAVRDGRVLRLLRSDLEPSPNLATRLAAIIHVLHPAA